MGEPRIRVLVAKPGLDGHDRGAKIVARALRDAGMEDVLLVVGSIIPDEDIPVLKQAGVAEVFQPGPTTQAIVEFIRKNVKGVPAA